MHIKQFIAMTYHQKFLGKTILRIERRINVLSIYCSTEYVKGEMSKAQIWALSVFFYFFNNKK